MKTILKFILVQNFLFCSYLMSMQISEKNNGEKLALDYVISQIKEGNDFDFITKSASYSSKWLETVIKELNEDKIKSALKILNENLKKNKNFVGFYFQGLLYQFLNDEKAFNSFNDLISIGKESIKNTQEEIEKFRKIENIGHRRLGQLDIKKGIEHYFSARSRFILACQNGDGRSCYFLSKINTLLNDTKNMQYDTELPLSWGFKKYADVMCEYELKSKLAKKYLENPNPPIEMLEKLAVGLSANMKDESFINTQIQGANFILGCIYDELGKIFKKQNKLTEAKLYFEKSIDTSNVCSCFPLAMIYLNEKEYYKAIKFYIKAYDLGDKSALFLVAIVYTNLDEEKAEQYFKQALIENHESSDNEKWFKCAKNFLLQREKKQVITNN